MTLCHLLLTPSLPAASQPSLFQTTCHTTPQLDLDWAFQMKDGVPQVTRQSLIPGGSVELTHENLFGDSQSLSLSLSSSDWRNPAADLGFQMSFTEPFYAPNTTRNVQVGRMV
jgi:outer membrane protein assembly factor BamA